MRYLKLVIWIVVIAILCFTPGNELDVVKINIPYFDKMVHFAMFYILALFIRGIAQLSVKQRIRWIVFSVLYAGLIELVQFFFIPLRSGDWIDLLADLVGLSAGWYTFMIYPKLLQRIFITEK